MFSHHLVGLRPCNYHIIDAAWNEISLTINSVCLNEEGRRRKGATLVYVGVTVEEAELGKNSTYP